MHKRALFNFFREGVAGLVYFCFFLDHLDHWGLSQCATKDRTVH